MSDLKPGAVLYAKNIPLVSDFYRDVAGLDVTHVESGHIVLESPNFQLVILQIPAAIAHSIKIETPPKRRTETPVKLVFPVRSISDARAAAVLHGGELNPSEREWTFQDCQVCDGHDPEGNVVQVRQNVR